MRESLARNICGSEAVSDIGNPHWFNTPCTKMPKNCLTPCCKLEIKKVGPVIKFRPTTDKKFHSVAKFGPLTIKFAFASSALSLHVHQDRITEQETSLHKSFKPN
jgi:hypothetical protein